MTDDLDSSSIFKEIYGEGAEGEVRSMFSPLTIIYTKETNTWHITSGGIHTGTIKKEKARKVIAELTKFYDRISQKQIDIVEAEFIKQYKKEENEKQRLPKKRAIKQGHVYFLKSNDHIKIGKSLCLNDRITSLSSHLPQKPQLMLSILAHDYTLLEELLHEYYAENRTNGEWFEIKEISCHQWPLKIRNLIGDIIWNEEYLEQIIADRS